MHLAIYGRGAENKDKEALISFFDYLIQKETPFTVEAGYAKTISSFISIKELKTFVSHTDLVHAHVNYIISLGGDGTLLDTLEFVKETNLPVLGINLGRLGFLSNVPKGKAIEAIESLRNGQFMVERRSLLELHSDHKFFGSQNYALNDFTIHKRDTGSMITIDTYLNGEFFNSYWADGIIVATPTGSTAYSLSCGGPVIFPDSNSFVITPVAPHNLNIRPIIVSDSTVIGFRIKGRGSSHLISLDSRYQVAEYSQELAVQKAPFFFNLIKLNHQNFINTLREKLSWGLDSRNF